MRKQSYIFLKNAMENKNLEEDIHSLLIKAVENNIDKFEYGENNKDLGYGGIIMSCKIHISENPDNFYTFIDHYFDLEIKYKDFKTRLADASLYERALNSLINRKKLEKEHLREKDLIQLRELCKNK